MKIKLNKIYTELLDLVNTKENLKKTKTQMKHSISPAFKSIISKNSRIKFDFSIKKSIAMDPDNEYWKDIADENNISPKTCYNKFINLYFKRFEKKFNPNIDKQLIGLVDDNVSWLDIAFTVNRSPFCCIKRYYNLMNISKNIWTKTEDELLIRTVKEFGDTDWKKIAVHFHNKSHQQCLQRFRKISENIRKGKWTKEEDEALKIAYEKYKTKGWIVISQHVPHRNDAQCRERWVNGVDPTIKKGKWSEEEDRKLEESVSNYGRRWVAISNEIKGRTDSQCKTRYDYLVRQNRIKKFRYSSSN